MENVRGLKILIAEDEYLLAGDLAAYFESMGAIVLGPIPSLKLAEPHVFSADAAVLDIDLNGELVFPLADQLLQRNIPFVFFSGHDGIAIPERFRHANSLKKPVSSEQLSHALFSQISAPVSVTVYAPASGQGADDVVNLLPELRHAARLMMQDIGAADRLVERVLEEAIAASPTRLRHVSLSDWLHGMLGELSERDGPTFLN